MLFAVESGIVPKKAAAILSTGKTDTKRDAIS
jgi:hypothetical protein